MPKALIVDDDADLVQLLTILLKSWNYEVASAGNPTEGQSVCREFKPDIVLLDYHMPGNTGAHLFETFRRNKVTARLPIIFMSAVASGDEVLRELDEADLAVFLPKPVHTPDLKKAMTDLLEAAAK